MEINVHLCSCRSRKLVSQSIDRQDSYDPMLNPFENSSDLEEWGGDEEEENIYESIEDIAARAAALCDQNNTKVQKAQNTPPPRPQNSPATRQKDNNCGYATVDKCDSRLGSKTQGCDNDSIRVKLLSNAKQGVALPQPPDLNVPKKQAPTVKEGSQSNCDAPPSSNKTPPTTVAPPTVQVTPPNPGVAPPTSKVIPPPSTAAPPTQSIPAENISAISASSSATLPTSERTPPTSVTQPTVSKKPSQSDSESEL